MQFGPAITQHSSRYVHHIVIYLCDALNHTNVGDSTVCEDAHINIGICRGTGVPIAVWAVGGNVCIYATINYYTMHVISNRCSV